MLFRIKDIRQELEMSQFEMANILGVTRSAYSLWELEKNIIPLYKLYEFSNTFNISMDYITRLSNKKESISKKNKIDKKEVGRKLRIIRKQNKITQEKLASIFNTTHSAISAYENGVTLIPTLFLLEFCKITNKSMDYICSKKEEKILINV